MDFVDVGAHCFYDLCGQQTFLPFKCDDCDHQFCRFHRKPETHRCPKFLNNKTNVNDKNNNNESKEEIKTNETKINSENKTTDSILVTTKTTDKENMNNNNNNNNNKNKNKKNKKPFKCNFKGCKKREWMEIVCNECHLSYCRKHRFSDDHNCQTVILNQIKNNTKMNDIGLKRQSLINKVLSNMATGNANNNNNNNNHSNGQHSVLVK